jgi:hypothetical protein
MSPLYVFFYLDNNCKEGGHASIILFDIHEAINRTACNWIVAYLNGDRYEASS